MHKTISAIAAAASIAAVVAVMFSGSVMLPGFTPQVEAHTSLMMSNTAAKADRLDKNSFGPACAQQSWPYYETSCLRNAKSLNREVRHVRVIAPR